jgi:ABC-type thiamine transport system ATPase subunit
MPYGLLTKKEGLKRIKCLVRQQDIIQRDEDYKTLDELLVDTILNAYWRKEENE